MADSVEMAMKDMDGAECVMSPPFRAVDGPAPMGPACSWPRVVPSLDAPPRSRTSHCHDKMLAVFAIFRGPGEDAADDADDDT